MPEEYKAKLLHWNDTSVAYILLIMYYLEAVIYSQI